jgi:two-component system, chemotaxis family, protein-glutamate methylesterase/glutaminase
VRALVVDDSMLFRKVVRDALAQQPGVEVVGSAGDGRSALEKIDQLKPDVITLDLEMPGIDGLEVLRQLKTRPSPPAVIVISALTEAGAEMTTKALRLGAFDFVLKPNGPKLDENQARLQTELLPKLEHLAERKHIALEVQAAPAKCDLAQHAPQHASMPMRAPEIIAIGISTGGPSALHEMLPKLPASLSVPIVIVQHMPPKFTKSLADDLNRHCALEVQEGVDGTRLQPGHVYLAPGGHQMKVEQFPRGLELRVTDDPAEKSCKPSVDYLFRSLADIMGPRVLAVIMTGMGDDGFVGCQILKRHGALVMAQDRASCVVYGMPRQIVEHGLADIIRPLDAIADTITEAVCGGMVCGGAVPC